MFLSITDNLRYKKLKKDMKNNYIMVMDGYPQDLLGVMKLLKNYITESGNNRNFNKTSGKYHRGVFFTQTQDNYSKDKKNINSKGGYHCFHCIK